VQSRLGALVICEEFECAITFSTHWLNVDGPVSTYVLGAVYRCDFAYKLTYDSQYDLPHKVVCNLISNTFFLKLVSDGELKPLALFMQILHEIERRFGRRIGRVWTAPKHVRFCMQFSVRFASNSDSDTILCTISHDTNRRLSVSRH
jgi:hypothetical protein